MCTYAMSVIWGSLLMRAISELELIGKCDFLFSFLSIVMVCFPSEFFHPPF